MLSIGLQTVPTSTLSFAESLSGGNHADQLASTASKMTELTDVNQTVTNNPLSTHESRNTQQNPSEANNVSSKEEKKEQETKAQNEIEQVVSQLKARDREVRAHEMAHVAVGGQHVTSGPTYQFQTGPDGNQYAVGGEVGIDTSPVSGDPQATLQKAIQVQAAALAPAEPSAQDRNVASAAAQMAAQARADIATQNQQSLSGEGDKSNTTESESDDSQLVTEASNGQQVSNAIGENRLLTALNLERNQFENRVITQSA